MRISTAPQAPKFIHYPAAALRAVLQIEDKGAIGTFMAITGYLWGDKTLEGSKAEWLTILNMQERSFERHVASIGHSGGLRYHQPQRGYYVLSGYPETDEEVALLRECWNEVESGQRIRAWEIASVVDALFLSRKASKLTERIIIASPDLDLSLSSRAPEKKEEEDSKASKLTLPAKPKARATTLPADFIADVVALGWRGGLANLEDIWNQGEAEAERLRDLAAYHKQHRDAYSGAMFWQEARDGIVRQRTKLPMPTAEGPLFAGEEPEPEPEIWQQWVKELSWTLPFTQLDMVKRARCIRSDEHALVLAVPTVQMAEKLRHPPLLGRMLDVLRGITGNGTVIEIEVQ